MADIIDPQAGPALPMMASIYKSGRYTRASVDPKRGQPLTYLAAAAEWRQMACLRLTLIDEQAAELATLRAELAASQARVVTLEAAVRWALGYDEGEPHFMPRKEGEGVYHWRAELRRRAAMG